VVEDVATARSRRAFVSALDHFERLLALTPAYPPGAITAADGRALGALADAVIGHIEERLDRHTDRLRLQLALASKIYQIRSDIEQVHRCARDDGKPAVDAVVSADR
jgi:hypothetical protein